MPGVDRDCITHHNACDCREKILADKITKLQSQLKKHEKENAHLRKVNGVKLKSTTVKQSLVFANEIIPKLQSQLKRYRDLLELILPMAKGYANAHDVGNNQKFIKEVEGALEE